MNTKIVKNVNSQGRLCLTKDLCEYAGIKQNSKVAISKGNNDNEIHIICIDKVGDFDEIIAFAQVDDKFRIIIPQEIREDDEAFEISATKRAVIIRKPIKIDDH